MPDVVQIACFSFYTYLYTSVYDFEFLKNQELNDCGSLLLESVCLMNIHCTIFKLIFFFFFLCVIDFLFILLCPFV